MNRIRVPYPFQWGAPSFDAGECFAMMMAAFVAVVEVCFLMTSFLEFVLNFQDLFILFVCLFSLGNWWIHRSF